jgi:hypothetical protein
MSKKVLLIILLAIFGIIGLIIIGVVGLLVYGVTQVQEEQANSCYNMEITRVDDSVNFNPDVTVSAFNAVSDITLEEAGDSDALFSGNNQDEDFFVLVYEDQIRAYTTEPFKEFDESKQQDIARDLGAIYGATIIDINSSDLNDFALKVQEGENYSSEAGGWKVDFQVKCE